MGHAVPQSRQGASKVTFQRREEVRGGGRILKCHKGRGSLLGGEEEGAGRPRRQRSPDGRGSSGCSKCIGEREQGTATYCPGLFSETQVGVRVSACHKLGDSKDIGGRPYYFPS